MPSNARDAGSQLDPWVRKEEEMTTHSSILAWRIPWTEEPGNLQSMWLQTVRKDWAKIEKEKDNEWIITSYNYYKGF